MVVQLDSDAKDAVLSLCQTDILAKLQTPTSDIGAKPGVWALHARVYSWRALHGLRLRPRPGRVQYAPSVGNRKNFPRLT